MNMLDMHTREKANKIHLDEMHQEARDRRLLRDADREGDLENIAINRGRIIALVVTALIALIVTILFEVIPGLHTIL